MRPRIIVLQHHWRADLGALEQPLAEAADIVVVRGYLPGGAREAVDRLVDDGEYDGVVALGGPMGVYERDLHPYLDDSLRLLADALERALPILGICLGSQMLSELLGSTVFNGADRGLAPQVGFLELHPTEEGAGDPLVRLFSDACPAFFSHRDSHELPAGAVRLASTDSGSLAVFRVGERTYGVQFHPEATAAQLAVWAADSPLAAYLDVDVPTLLRQAEGMDQTIRSRARGLVALFLSWTTPRSVPR